MVSDNVGDAKNHCNLLPRTQLWAKIKKPQTQISFFALGGYGMSEACAVDVMPTPFSVSLHRLLPSREAVSSKS